MDLPSGSRRKKKIEVYTFFFLLLLLLLLFFFSPKSHFFKLVSHPLIMALMFQEKKNSRKTPVISKKKFQSFSYKFLFRMKTKQKCRSIVNVIVEKQQPQNETILKNFFCCPKLSLSVSLTLPPSLSLSFCKI